MARKSIQIPLTEQQREELVTMQRSLKLERRYVDRAKIILFSVDGKTIDAIMSETRLTRRVVNKWRQRFLHFGMDGLKDKRRSDKKPTITAEQKAMVVQ